MNAVCANETRADDCLHSLLAGDHLAQPDLAPFYSSFSSRRFDNGNWMYQMNASMPLPASAAAPHDLPGPLNISVHFAAGLGGSEADVLPSALTVNDLAGGPPYMFQLHPEVEGVSPAEGAVQGECCCCCCCCCCAGHAVLRSGGPGLRS
jgi:hypothetical protein